MIKCYTILILYLLSSCEMSTSNSNIHINDSITIDKVAYSKEFISLGKKMKLNVLQGDSSYIDNFNTLVHPYFVFYEYDSMQWVLKSQLIVENTNNSIELENGKVNDKNGIIIADINGDGIMEFFGKQVWNSGSFPPYFMLATTDKYDIFYGIEIDRFPVFYPKYNVLTITSGKLEVAETTYYTFDYKSKELIEISDSFYKVMSKDFNKEEINFSLIE